MKYSLFASWNRIKGPCGDTAPQDSGRNEERHVLTSPWEVARSGHLPQHKS